MFDQMKYFEIFHGFTCQKTLAIKTKPIVSPLINLFLMSTNNKTKKRAPKTLVAKPEGKTTLKQSKLHKIVGENAHFEFLANGKIRCLITKHEFLPTLENYQAYLTSKSYKSGTESQFDLTVHEDYLIAHKESKNFLFCRLTGVKLPNKKTAVERHISCKKFQKRLEEYLKDKTEMEEEAEEEKKAKAERKEKRMENQERKEKKEKKEKKIRKDRIKKDKDNAKQTRKDNATKEKATKSKKAK